MDLNTLQMLMEDKEIWIHIKGSNGLYQISQFGNIKSFKQDKQNGNLIKGYHKHGYIRFRLIINCIKKEYLLHRILAEHFIENNNNQPIVDHIDRNKQNNRLDNLRWVSHSTNVLNRDIQINNRSGVAGIWYDNDGRKQPWRCSSYVNGKRLVISFQTREDAIKYKQENSDIPILVYDNKQPCNKKYHENKNDYENEEWKLMENSNDYAVSSYGRIKSYKKNKDGIFIYGTCINNYVIIELRINSKSIIHSIHRLVAKYFLPNPNNLPLVDHIDGNSLNNHIDNLRWCSYIHNAQNTEIYKNNKSGVKGVCIQKSLTKPWLSYWYVNGKRFSKSFEEKEQAIEYRKQMVYLYYSDKHYIETRI